MTAMPSFLLFYTLILTSSIPDFPYFLKLKDITIHYYKKDEKEAKRMLNQIPQIERELREIAGITIPYNMDIYLCPTKEIYQSLFKVELPAWSDGAALIKENKIAIISSNEKMAYHPFTKTLAHEIVHLAIHQYLNDSNSIPRWLDEGIASFVGSSWSIENLISLSYLAYSGRIIPFKELENSFPKNEISAKLSYFQSQKFIEFYLIKSGNERLQKLLKELKSGRSVYEAFRFATNGSELSDLEDEFKIWLRRRYFFLPLITSISGIWIFITLLFFYVFIRKKSLLRKRLEMMEVEEGDIDLKC